MKISEVTFLPLSAGLMFYPSLVLQVALDGAQSTYYGFPLPWNASSTVISLAKNIYWLPLIVDIFFYSILGYIVCKYISKYIAGWPPVVKQMVLASIWLYGLVSVWLMTGILSLDSMQYFWLYDNFKVISFASGFSV
ncbi:MAG TPA: hypothetical protein ENJ08_10445 [Gammaproteobacteria bacterium]|nr:hypothetical protein [Gammaproteobacteria bacterium]